MRKIKWKPLIGQSLIVCGLILLGLSFLGKSGSNPDMYDRTYAVLHPNYNDVMISDGRLNVSLESVSTVARLVEPTSPSIIYYFIAFVFGVVIVNNVVMAYQNFDDSNPSEDLKQDDLSFRRLHSYLSHEQKNNLAIIRSRMEIAKDYETLAYIDRISHSMDDVLTLSDDGVVEDLETVDMTLLVAQVCDDYRTLAPISYDFDTSNNLVQSKYQWIYRAMSNLLDNAVKFSDGKDIKIKVETKNNTVIVCVEDHGIGIPGDELEKIFNHEYRINTLKSDGYGIGLSLVNRVCDLSGGVVWVESELGVGTTFYLCFPELTLD